MHKNFGSCALRAKGFKNAPFTQDKAGTITHVIPPQKLARTYALVSGTTFTTTFDNVTVAATNNSHGIVVGDYVRFETSDNIESYLVTAVNSTSGDLTLNRGYRNFHVKASNDSVIQAVSVFAVGFADHFVAESGGDQSITCLLYTSPSPRDLAVSRMPSSA